jgi:hypothetical protein
MRTRRNHTGFTALTILLIIIMLVMLEAIVRLAGLGVILGSVFAGGWLLGSRYPIASVRKHHPRVIEASSYEPYSPGHADTSRSRDDLVSTPFSGVHDLR